MLEKEDVSLLRKLQLLETEMLIRTAEICNKYHLSYSLNSGTLLGAVRHGGFIPWDDDIDIEMPIEDYRRFLEIAQSELGDEYFVQTCLTDPNFHFAYTRIRKNNTTFMNPYHRSHKIHHGVWIDVFPLIPINTGISVTLTKKWLKLCNMIQIQEHVKSHKEEFKRLLGPLAMSIITASNKIPMNIRQNLHMKMLNVVFNRNPDKCSHRTYVWGNITQIIPKEVYSGGPKEILFEGHLFKVPNDYKRYLHIVFGDYMKLPPIEERHGHGREMIIDLENSYEKYMFD